MIIDTSKLHKDIHFPITKAIYQRPSKRNWFQNILKFFTYRRWFQVMEDYIIWVPLLKAFVLIPATFKCDLASVPKLLNGIYNSNGILLLGSYPHDFGYRYQCLILVDEFTGELSKKIFSKKELDDILESLCSLESGFKKASWVAKFVLSFAGYIGWFENRKYNYILNDDFPELFTDASLEE